MFTRRRRARELVGESALYSFASGDDASTSF
jgi:hypothetical protein